MTFRQSQASAHLEKRMQDTFNQESAALRRGSGRGPIPRAYLNRAIDFIDRSEVLAKVLEWDTASRKSAAGRKSYIDARAVLVLILLHFQLGYGANYQHIADSLEYALNAEDLTLLNITNVSSDREDWYKRFCRATHRLIAVMDPHPGPRRHRLDAAEYAAALANFSPEHLARIDWLCESLVHTSVRHLPKDLWDKYTGNVAVDATLVCTAGFPNPSDQSEKRANADFSSGRYRREGAHDGQGATTDKAGFELETGSMVWPNPGENGLYPSLITSVSFHKPGEVRREGLKVVTSHNKLGAAHGLVIVDRAYNNSKADNFQRPLRLAGHEFVFDYKEHDHGKQDNYEDLLLVDGFWYVRWMPVDLITAWADWRYSRISYAAAAKLSDARAPYAMIPKGRPDADGFQRFTYPLAGTYLAIDPDTLKRVKPITARSLTVPMTTKGLKHLQKYPYRSPAWLGHMGMRSLVESSNKTLKDHNFEDLRNIGKRSGRGFAFQYLAATMAAVSSNLRKISQFFLTEATTLAGGKLTRQRRRKGPDNQLLPTVDPANRARPPS